MNSKTNYERQIKQLCKDIQKEFYLKYNILSLFIINHKLKKIIKLNRKNRNENIDDIMKMVGRLKIKYKRFCKENDYYKESYIINKINEAYIKLSKKSMKIKTKKSYVKNSKTNMEIEYNSDKGAYEIKCFENGINTSSRIYKVKSMKNLDRKREKVLKELKRHNYGINIFEELNVDESKFYKINPDIIHILVKEGKFDYAKMYIKEVLSGEPLHKPLKIKYVLNRDLKKGRLSLEENKIVKKMVKKDRISSELVIFDTRKTKKIPKLKINIFEKLEKILKINTNYRPVAPAYSLGCAEVKKDFYSKYKVEGVATYKSVNNKPKVRKVALIR